MPYGSTVFNRSPAIRRGQKTDQRPILAIDPGTSQSAYVLWDGVRILECSIEPNDKVLARLDRTATHDRVACEMIASYGMAVGREVFETCLWIGRFIERSPRPVSLVYRRDVKLHLCNSVRAKDGNVRQALIDRHGVVGTKRNPGPLFGARSHVWAALAVAVYAIDTKPWCGAVNSGA